RSATLLRLTPQTDETCGPLQQDPDRYTRYVDPEAERKAREIVLAARGERKKWPRAVWVVAIVVAVACVTALAIAWWQDRDTIADHPLDRQAATQSSGLGLGLLVGLGVGIAIGSIFAVRRRQRL